MANKEFGYSALYSKCERSLKGSSAPKKPSYSFRGQEVEHKSVNTTAPFVGSKKTQQYTGTSMMGIAVSHKSNLVPVFSDEAAVDLANMRR